MAPIGAADLRRRLQRLDRPTFVAFVADLWRASGWTVEVDGAVVTARRGGDARRLFVLPPYRFGGRWRSVEPPDVIVDVVVTHRTATDRSALPRGAPDAVVVGAVDLRERLLYAVSDDERRRLGREYLDADLSAQDSSRSDGGRRTPPHPDDVDWRALDHRAAVAAVVLLAGVALVAALVLGGTLASDGPDRAEVGALDASVANDRPLRLSVAEPVDQTCDRGPEAVVTAVLASVTKGHGVAGPQTLWRFYDPEVRSHTKYQTFRGFYGAPRFEPLWTADRVAVDGVSRDGDTATVMVEVVEGNSTGRYRFGLVRRGSPDRQGCWTVNDLTAAGPFEPTGPGETVQS